MRPNYPILPLAELIRLENDGDDQATHELDRRVLRMPLGERLDIDQMSFDDRKARDIRPYR